jgi:hypothetical protein
MATPTRVSACHEVTVPSRFNHRARRAHREVLCCCAACEATDTMSLMNRQHAIRLRLAQPPLALVLMACLLSNASAWVLADSAWGSHTSETAAHWLSTPPPRSPSLVSRPNDLLGGTVATSAPQHKRYLAVPSVIASSGRFGVLMELACEDLASLRADDGSRSTLAIRAPPEHALF